MNATRDGLTENEALRLVETWSAEGVALAASSPNLTWALHDLFTQVEAAGGAWGSPASRPGPAP